MNKIVPGVKPILFQIRKSGDEIDSADFNKAAAKSEVSVHMLEWNYATADVKMKGFP